MILHFQNGVTLTDEDWFNDINDFYYTIFGEAGTLASARAAFFSGAPSFTASAIFALSNVQVGGTLSVSAKSSLTTLAVSGVLSSEGGVFGASIATQANMESAASAGSTSLIVTPGRQQYHPGSAKAWVVFDGSATSVTAAASYNVTAITDNGSGNYTVSWITPFSSANYVVLTSSKEDRAKLQSVSSVNAQVVLQASLGTAVDSSIVCITAFGDQ